jgi:hypothetical protein
LRGGAAAEAIHLCCKMRDLLKLTNFWLSSFSMTLNHAQHIPRQIVKIRLKPDSPAHRAFFVSLPPGDVPTSRVKVIKSLLRSFSSEKRPLSQNQKPLG